MVGSDTKITALQEEEDGEEEPRELKLKATKSR